MAGALGSLHSGHLMGIFDVGAELDDCSATAY